MDRVNSQIMVREINDPEGIAASVPVISDSFKTVAQQFGLTPQNCPTHPTYVTTNQLNYLRKKGLRFFGLFFEEKQVGFIAIETNSSKIFRFEKLAVLPEYRHHGYGAALVKFALDYARKNQAEKVVIGIIHEHTILKQWYEGLGFKETGTQKFNQLHFTVSYMEIAAR